MVLVELILCNFSNLDYVQDLLNLNFPSFLLTPDYLSDRKAYSLILFSVL
jgi:hypothetical protein